MRTSYRRGIVYLLVPVIVVALLSSSQIAPSILAKMSTVSEEKVELMKLEREWGQAYITDNLAFVDRILAPDWTGWLDQSGEDKAEEIADFKSGKNRSLENIIDQEKVRVYGDTAIVEARERVRTRGSEGEHWTTWHITDVWVRQSGKWQVVATHESTLTNP